MCCSASRRFRARPGEPARDNPLLGPPPGSSGTLRAAFEPGGTTYLNAYRSVGNPPLLLAVSLSERETLSAWWLQAVVAFTLVAGFLILLLSAERAITRAIGARAAPSGASARRRISSRPR